MMVPVMIRYGNVMKWLYYDDMICM